MPNRLRTTVIGALTVCFALLNVPTGHGTTVEKMNVAKLIEYSELILVGQVAGVTDGFDGNNLPYTEVTLQVAEAIKGTAGGNYTFRQFGLMAPRDLGDGRTYVGVSPDGFPRFKVGEQVIVFLHARTALGFQSSAGLLQGKFLVENSQVFNGINNAGLFEDIAVDPELLTDAEQKMITKQEGKCPAATFRSFVRKAIEQDIFNPAAPRPDKEPDYEER
jgi:hypothetical protein